MTAYEKLQILIQCLGTETVLEQLAQALSTDELADDVNYIAKNNDIEWSDYETNF